MANAVINRSANTVVEEKRLLREKMQRWLSPPDPSLNHNIARSIHHAGTTSWFFQGDIFTQWKLSPSLLWIHGKRTSMIALRYSTPVTPVTPLSVAGSGKSVLWFVIFCYSFLRPLRLSLSSGIIEDIKAQHEAGSAIMAYFYCDFRDKDKQNCRNLVLSIIYQLCAQSNLCCDTLSHIYLAHDEGTRKPSDETLIKSLTEMVSLLVQGPIYLIVDALDECPNNSSGPGAREEVLDLINSLVGLRLPNLYICITSRPEIDIQTTLEPLTPLCISLHNQSGQKADIVGFIRSLVYSDPKMRRWREEDKILVIDKLSEGADGM